jgi:site-specific recombinase XerD
VLEVVARTGLRIGDVLRAPLGALRDGYARQDGLAHIVVKGQKPVIYSLKGGGGAQEAWKELLFETRKAPASWTVAAAVMGDPSASSEAGQGAYTRVEDVCKRIGEQAKARGRIHLHRFRRSVAVYLLQDGATEDQVRQVLLQASTKVLREYSDESRALESAKLLSSLDRKKKR